MISKDPKVIMNETQFVERLVVIKNRKTFYKNKYPYNLCYVNKDGRTSADCVNLVKAILNGYNVYNNLTGYYQSDLKNTGDCTETELLAQCTDVSQDFTILDNHPRILYMQTPQRHIGVYLGHVVDGKYNVIECTTSFGGGVVYSWVDSDGTRRKYKSGGKNCKWSHHGLPTRWVSLTEGTTPAKPKVDVSKYPVLRKGSKGEYVRKLQTELVAKGYDPKGIDGIFGPGCDKAVRQFQKDKGLVVDGCVGPKTWNALYN